MVRDDDCVDALGHGAARVVGAEDPLHDERTLPELAKPGMSSHLGVSLYMALMPPSKRCSGRPSSLRAIATDGAGMPSRTNSASQRGRASACGAKRRPPRGRGPRDPGPLPERPLARAAGRRRRVDREDEPLDAGALHALDDRRRGVAAAEVVELVEDRPARHGHDLLDRGRGRAAHEHQRPRRAGRARDPALPVAVADRELPARRQADRHRDLVAANRGAQVALGVPPRDMWPEEHLLERREVGPRRHVGAAAAVVVLEDALRQPSPRELAGVVDRLDPRDSRPVGHASTLPVRVSS